MALPFILPAFGRLLGGAARGAFGGFRPQAFAPMLGARAGAVPGQFRRRRRRALLTNRELADLTAIKNILGKTAAAEALSLLRSRR